MKPRKRKPRPSRAKLPPAEARAIGDANLRPAKPGEIRNPTGKNGSNWRKILNDFAAGSEADGEESRFVTALRAVFLNVRIGREASQKLFIEQIGGRARQHIEIQNGGNGPAVTFLLPGNGRDVEASAPSDDAASGSPDDEDQGQGQEE